MLSRPFVVLWFSMLVAMVGISMVSPLLPVYVQDDLGGPAVAVALSFSGLSIAQIVAAPFVGRLGDRFGPKRFIVIGFVVYAMGAFGYLLASHWLLVIIFRVLSGIGAAGVFPMSLAYVGRLAPEGREGKYMGWFSVAQVTGFGLGPLFGGGLRDLFGLDFAFTTMGLMLGGTALAAFVLLPEQRAPVRSATSEEPVALPFSALIRRPSVQASTLLVGLTALGMGATMSWLAVYVIDDEGLGTDSALFVGVLMSSRSLINAFLQPWTGPLADRMNRIVLVTVGLAVAGVAQLTVPFVPPALFDTSIFGAGLTIAPWVLVALIVAGVGEAMSQPAQQAIFVQVGRRVGMGSLMGLNSMGMSLGFLSGSLLAAGVKSVFGIESVFIMAGGATLLGLLVFFALLSRARDELMPPRAAVGERVSAEAAG